ncbi:hypothetical protein GCM10008932_02440 [Alkalibacterium iburiense]|uniref:Transposase n=1 Tax=Alkalibacterium iburiense TaxID=290589 RepID=A0ABN0X2D3_9LACT
MEVMVETCCGIDVHQKSITCCILDGPLDTAKPKKVIRTFGTRTFELREALSWMIDHGVTDLFMESTGQYWVPVFNIFSDSDIHQMLCNAEHVKNVPGRKTDVKDAEWLAQLGRVGLLRSSYIPTPEVGQLRLLTRRRKAYGQKLTQTKNEMHNILQRGNIKLTSFLSDIYGTTGLRLIELFVDGEVLTLERVEACRHGRVKASAEDLLLAMDGKLSFNDRFLLSESLEEFYFYTKKVNRIKAVIKEYALQYFPLEYGLLQKIPGINEESAAVILGEIGPNVEAFESAGHLASWAGLSPGSYESAGKSYSSRTTRGNKYLKSALVTSGGIAGNSRDRPFSYKYHVVFQRTGKKLLARVACAHKLIRIIYKVLNEKVEYNAERALGLRQQHKSSIQN